MNLSEVVVRESDTFESLKRKVRIATFLGTLQATLTDFKYLSEDWRKNTEEEALLGVSLTGIMDHPMLSSTDNSRRWVFNKNGDWKSLSETLEALKEVAIETNKEYAKRLGINISAAITAVN